MSELPEAIAGIGLLLIILSWILATISIVVVALRFYNKIFRLRRVTADDYLILLSLVFAIFHIACITLSVEYGLGHYTADLTEYQKVHTMEWGILSQPQTVCASLFGRISFAVLLLGVLGRTKSLQRSILIALIIIQILANLPIILQIYCQCGSHLSAAWTEDPTVKCNSQEVAVYMGYVHGSINSVSDLALAVLPGTILWDLKMEKKLKIGLVSIMSLSVFAMSASIAKTINLRNLLSTENPTRAMAYLFICAAIEENVVIIGASMATLRSLVTRSKNHNTSNIYAYDGKGPRDLPARPSGIRNMFSRSGHQASKISSSHSRTESTKDVLFDSRSEAALRNMPKEQPSKNVLQNHVRGLGAEDKILPLGRKGDGYQVHELQEYV